MTACPKCGGALVVSPTLHCPTCASQITTIELPKEPADTRPSWQRRYFCPQCPRYNQPTEGFDVVSFQEHVFNHAITVLRDAARDAHQYRAQLESIDGLLKQTEAWQWPAHALRRDVRYRVDVALRRDDEAYWEKRRAEMDAEAADVTKCSACGRALETVAKKLDESSKNLAITK